MSNLKVVPRLSMRTKKRFFGIVAVAVILIAALGAGYYFRFKSNQSHFKKYGLEILDSYHNRIERQLNNEILSVLSKSTDTTYYSKTIKSAIDSLYDHIDLENGFLNQPFSEFVITIIPKDKGVNDILSIKTMNSLYLGKEFAYDSLLAKDSLNNGLVKNYKTSGSDYLLFGRKYQFEYTFDKEYSSEIVLIGLVNGTTYNKATRELDPWVITLLLTFLLISLFGLPFFKMIFITSEERVFSSDVIGAGFSLVIGASLVIVIFMSLIQYSYTSQITLQNDLKQMGINISEKFVSENNANVAALTTFDFDNYQKELKDAKTKKKKFVEIKYKESPYIEHFKFILTIDSSGNIQKTINLIKAPDSEKFPVNIGNRQYVKDFKNKKNIWRTVVNVNDSVQNINGTPINKDLAIDYVMRPVVSIENREEEAVYIIEDKIKDQEDKTPKGRNYRVASAQLSSIHLPVLPFGFQYAIIDDSKNGDVWFHSQPGKSSLEEFFKVSRDANDLRSAIYARVETSGRLNYHGSNFLYFITPIKDTNLNVVILYDLALLRLQTSEVLSITAIAISLVFAIVGLICLFTIVFRVRKSRLFKEEQFIFDFLTPRDSYKNRYLFLIYSFALLTPLLVVFGLKQDFNPLPAFLGSMLAVVWSYILVYYVLYPQQRSNIKFYIHNVLFLIAIGTLNTLIWHLGTEVKAVFLRSILLQGVCLVLIILSQYVIAQDKPKQCLDSGDDATTSLGTESATSKKTNTKKAKLFSLWPFKFPISPARTYSIFLFSWFLAAAIVPSIIIYLKAEKLNETIWIKTNHIVMSKDYLSKQKKLERIIPRIKEDYLDHEYNCVYMKHLDNGKYMANKYTLQDAVMVDEIGNTLSDSTSYFRELLWSTRPIFNEKIRNFKGMVYQNASDKSWTSEPGLESIELSSPNTYKKDFKIVSKWSEDQASLDNNRGADILFALLRIFGIVTLLGLMYAMVYFYIIRFYGFRFCNMKPINFDTDKEIDYDKEFGKILSYDQSNSGLLLIGLPFSGKSEFAEKIVASCEKVINTDEAIGEENKNMAYEHTAYLSFLKLDEVKIDKDIEIILNSLSESPLFTKESYGEAWDTQKWKRTKYFIIENLEHGLKSFQLNRMKLKVISHLIAHKKRVVITSEVYPNQVVAIYKPFLERETFNDENSPVSDHHSWRNIFGSFPQILVGMTNQKNQVRELIDKKNGVDKQFDGSAPKKSAQEANVIKTDNKKPDQEQINTEIVNEVGYSQFLPKLAPIMIAKYKPDDYDKQSMVLHVQKLSHGYYTDIWNALPARERYMLYDLAKDGFMNIKNANSLFSLMKKGLIVWRNRPVVFNQSFQNFILSFTSKKDALQLEIRNRKDGSWATIKIVMYMVIITLVVLILLGEPGLLDDFEALLAALGGLGVILPVLSTVLGKSGEK